MEYSNVLDFIIHVSNTHTKKANPSFTLLNILKSKRDSKPIITINLYCRIFLFPRFLTSYNVYNIFSTNNSPTSFCLCSLHRLEQFHIAILNLLSFLFSKVLTLLLTTFRSTSTLLLHFWELHPSTSKQLKTL